MFGLSLVLAILFFPQSNFFNCFRNVLFYLRQTHPGSKQSNFYNKPGSTMLPAPHPSVHFSSLYLPVYADVATLLYSAVIGCVSVYIPCHASVHVWIWLLLSFALRFGPLFLISWLFPQRPAHHAGVPGYMSSHMQPLNRFSLSLSLVRTSIW